MKLATLLQGDRRCVVVADPQQALFWHVRDVFAGLPDEASADMIRAIAALADRTVPERRTGSGSPLRLTQLLAPIPTPPHNVMCVGKNYRSHTREFHMSGFDASAATVTD